MRLNGTTLLLLALAGAVVYYLVSKNQTAAALPVQQQTNPNGGYQTQSNQNLFNQVLGLIGSGVDYVVAQTAPKTT